MRVLKEYHKLDTRIAPPGDTQADLPNSHIKQPENNQESPLSDYKPGHDTVDGYLRTPESPKVSFEEFASDFWLRQHQEAQRRSLQKRVHATRISICLSARLLRTGTTVQKGLIESFKHADKSGFVAIYNSIHDVREGCDSSWRRVIRGHDPLVDSSPATLESDRGHSINFAQQLTAKSQKDLLEILHLARTDSQFLFERIGSLMPAQLSALLSTHSQEVHDSTSSLSSRGRGQYLFSKRNVTSQSATFKEHAMALERTNSMSALIFNIFAAPLDQDSAEARLRLDVWSSTCAKFISQGGNGHHALLGHLLSSWSTTGKWKAKIKLELYLMDILQKGAFLLEPMTNLGLDMETIDHLRSDLAEEFFESAVRDLFEVLDDSDGGLPSGSLEFGNAVYGKLDLPESRNRFLEYTFFQWFFRKFLHNALSFPEVPQSHLISPVIYVSLDVLTLFLVPWFTS